jgi:hypothetical protein
LNFKFLQTTDYFFFFAAGFLAGMVDVSSLIAAVLLDAG